MPGRPGPGAGRDISGCRRPSFWADPARMPDGSAARSEPPCSRPKSERTLVLRSGGRYTGGTLQRTPDLILASASPRRRELLMSMGLALAVEPVDLDEAVHD